MAKPEVIRGGNTDAPTTGFAIDHPTLLRKAHPLRSHRVMSPDLMLLMAIAVGVVAVVLIALDRSDRGQ